MYEYFENEELRGLLKQEFPAGMRMVFVDGYLIRIEGESIDEVWVVCQPEEDEFLWRKGYLDDMVQAMELITDFWNIAIETAERSIPLNIADPRVIPPETLKRKGRRVGEFLWAKKEAFGTFREAVHQIKAAEFDPNMTALAQVVLDTYREITGLVKAVFGASQSETARGKSGMPPRLSRIP